MNWLSLFLSALHLVPGVVAGIENIHGSAKSGADKKTLALQSLGLASGAAAAAAPQDATIINAATSAVGEVIDSTVDLFNAVGWPHQAAPTPAPPTPAKS